jgi:hypothetical protein
MGSRGRLRCGREADSDQLACQFIGLSCQSRPCWGVKRKCLSIAIENRSGAPQLDFGLLTTTDVRPVVQNFTTGAVATCVGVGLLSQGLYLGAEATADAKHQGHLSLEGLGGELIALVPQRLTVGSSLQAAGAHQHGDQTDGHPYLLPERAEWKDRRRPR